MFVFNVIDATSDEVWSNLTHQGVLELLGGDLLRSPVFAVGLRAWMDAPSASNILTFNGRRRWYIVKDELHEQVFDTADILEGAAWIDSEQVVYVVDELVKDMGFGPHNSELSVLYHRAGDGGGRSVGRFVRPRSEFVRAFKRVP